MQQLSFRKQDLQASILALTLVRLDSFQMGAQELEDTPSHSSQKRLHLVIWTMSIC